MAEARVIARFVLRSLDIRDLDTAAHEYELPCQGHRPMCGAKDARIGLWWPPRGLMSVQSDGDPGDLPQVDRLGTWASRSSYSSSAPRPVGNGVPSRFVSIDSILRA